MANTTQPWSDNLKQATQDHHKVELNATPENEMQTRVCSRPCETTNGAQHTARCE